MNIALVGCGRISKNHFESIKEFPNDLNLVAVCDIVEEKAKKAGDKYGTKYYTKYKKMLEQENIDIVSVCTPSGLHPKHGIMAAKKGINVVTEKPMGITLNSVDDLIKVTDENKVKLFVVKQNRLNTTMQLLKKAILKNRFGRIYMVQSNVFWQRPQEYYDMADWRGTWEFDGGAFMNQASHYVDALYWLIGSIESVTAETATLSRKIEAEDSGSAVIKFRNGAIGSINVTMLTYPKNYEGSITILGEKGTVKIGGLAVNNISKWEFEDYDDDDKFIEQSNYNPPNVYGYGHIPYYQNVIDTLKGKSKANTDGRSGRKSLELILGIYRSAKTGKRVKFPL